MAQASPRTRKERRVKRQRTQAIRAAESFMDNAYRTRLVAMSLEQELKKRDAALLASLDLLKTYFEETDLPMDAYEELASSIKAKFEAAPPEERPNRGGVAAQLDAEAALPMAGGGVAPAQEEVPQVV